MIAHPGLSTHARGGTRTLTLLKEHAPETCASTNSATLAYSFVQGIRPKLKTSVFYPFHSPLSILFFTPVRFSSFLEGWLWLRHTPPQKAIAPAAQYAFSASSNIALFILPRFANQHGNADQQPKPQPDKEPFQGTFSFIGHIGFPGFL